MFTFFGPKNSEPSLSEMFEAITKIKGDIDQNGPPKRPSDMARFYAYNPTHHLSSFHGFVETNDCPCGGADGAVVTGFAGNEYESTYVAVSTFLHHGGSESASVVFYKLDEAKALVNTLSAAIAATEQSMAKGG